MNNVVRVEDSKYLTGQGGSGGSGGHTIQNDSGTDLPQESALQFVGVYSEDDSTNGKTKVNIIREMTKAQMDALSTDAKKGVIHTTDEADNPANPISADEVSYGSGSVESYLNNLAANQVSYGSGTVKDALNELGSRSAGNANNVGTGCKYTYSRSKNEMTFVILQHSGGSNYVFGVWVSDRFNIISQSGSIITVDSVAPFSLELTINTRYSVTYALSVTPIGINKSPIGA